MASEFIDMLWGFTAWLLWTASVLFAMLTGRLADPTMWALWAIIMILWTIAEGVTK